MAAPEHSGSLPPHAMSEAELAAIRAPYETLIGFVPPSDHGAHGPPRPAGPGSPPARGGGRASARCTLRAST